MIGVDSGAQFSPVPETCKFTGAIVFCPHPSNGTCLYVSRRGLPELLGGLPGGKLDPEESFREAAKREFREETGLELAHLLETPLWSGIAKKTQAYCEVFLGLLDQDTWDRLPQEFIGPEGLIVRISPWEGLIDESQCEFGEYNIRFFQAVSHNSSLLADVFISLGLEDPLKRITARAL